MSDRPVIQLAKVDYIDGEVVLFMQSKEGTDIEFTLDPMAAGILALTMTPVLRLALADLKQKHPEVERQGFPDTPEGL